MLAIVDEHIRNTFGGDNGRQAFEEQWHPDSPDSRLWNELGGVLALGGTFHDRDTFMAPYTYSRWPEQLDAMDHTAIVGAQMRVRALPHDAGAVVASLSFVVVPLAPRLSDQTPDWTSIRLRDGRVGYVASQYVRSSLDYRAIFSRAGDTWRMTAFVAGD